MKVRFAPSPAGSLHIGNALGAVANRNLGGPMLLRIEDTDPARNLVWRPVVRLPGGRPTLARFRELRASSPDRLDVAAAKEIVRELNAVGGQLRAVRAALAGRERGPQRRAVLAALPGVETLARVDAAV